MAVAFAIYCEDDHSFIFYKRDEAPSVGDTFENRTVTALYEVNEGRYDVYPPWIEADWRELVTNVSFADTIAPIALNSWFSGFKSLTAFDGVNLDTSGVYYFDGMFTSCNSLTTLDLSTFNTSKAVGMTSVFEGCSGLTHLDLTSFDTSNVEMMRAMFDSCSNLRELDLTSFDTGKVRIMDYMFMFTSKLERVYVSERWSTASVNSSEKMFYGSALSGKSTDDALVTAGYANYNGGYLTYKQYLQPEDLLIRNILLRRVADAIREKTGGSESIVADAFPDEVSSIVTLSEGTADATAAAADILTGKTAYVNGAKVTGTGFCLSQNYSAKYFSGNFYINASSGDTGLAVKNCFLVMISYGSNTVYMAASYKNGTVTYHARQSSSYYLDASGTNFCIRSDSGSTGVDRPVIVQFY